MNHVLVVEDDARFNYIICEYLNKNSYAADGCLNPAEAYDMLYRKDYDLIISDIMMPKIDGIDFAQAVREKDEDIPILFVTALDDTVSKKRGFGAGIDDYMVKPIDLEELLMRIRALLRRSQMNSNHSLQVGRLKLIRDEMSAFVDGEEIPLMPKEFQILYKLLSYPKKIFTRSELLNDYWAMTNDSGLRSVDVYITKLRKKFAACDSFEIQTVHGFGYKAVLKES